MASNITYSLETSLNTTPSQSANNNPVNSSDKPEIVYARLVSDEAVNVVEIALYIVFAGSLGLLGIVANSLNISVFLKQGLQESAQVSLFCLSCSDLAISLTIVMASTNRAVDKLNPDLPADLKGVHMAVAGYPLTYCSRLSMVTTMVLCLERCLCVKLPLSVKSIVTRRRTIMCLTFFYLEITGFYLTYFLFISLEWKFVEARNRSELLLVEHKLMRELKDINHTVNSISVTLLCFVIVSVSSIVMVVAVRKAASTRSRMVLAKYNQYGEEDKKLEGGLSMKDARLVKMVVYVAILFLFAHVPTLVMDFATTYIEPGLKLTGKYRNINEVLWSLVTSFAALNASMNIFIYYLVSERYKKQFRALVFKESL